MSYILDTIAIAMHVGLPVPSLALASDAAVQQLKSALPDAVSSGGRNLRQNMKCLLELRQIGVSTLSARFGVPLRIALP